MNKKPQQSAIFETLAPRITIKFPGRFKLNYSDGIDKKIGPGYFKDYWDQLKKDFPGITLKRKFSTLNPKKINELTEKASEMDPNYRPGDFLSFFTIDCNAKLDDKALFERLKKSRLFERVYLEAGPVIPPFVNPDDDPRSTGQGYLGAAPAGIDARYAWTFGGGDGAGIGFVDMERGWTLNHEDLSAAGITLISGVNQDFHGHGTSVLGEIRAVDNTIGCIGIAANCNARVISQYRTVANYNTADAIMAAIAVMSFGDVLLLEAQTTNSAGNFVPVEVDLAEYEAIRLGSALGIIIVEAGGNGGIDLDAHNDPVDGLILNRASADFRDSGAILVGAASSGVPHRRDSISNFGSRVDCYAWGRNVNTTGDGWEGTSTSSYTNSFSGTSSASPMIAGAALLIQGIVQAATTFRFSPQQIRAILSDPANGTASNTPLTDKIGVMPNLRLIVDNVLELVPDVMIRDFVGDSGLPHTGAASSSPDVITRPVAVANPQAAFGEGSGTENSSTLGFEVEKGQDNFIYVRVQNRRDVDATNVSADVYWSEVATLVTPDLWHFLGSVNIPLVPSSGALQVSNAITWPSASIPATGHYCYVCMIGTAGDPAPAPAEFINFNNFMTFIRSNNNVTWRNFNIINSIPPPAAPPPGFVELPFLLTAAPDKEREFVLEIVSRLPAKARVFFEVPLEIAAKFKMPFENIKIVKNRKTAMLPVWHKGRFRLNPVMLPPKLQAKCKLHVFIPEENRKHDFEIAIRQLYKEAEAGRITWRLSPLGKKQKGKKKAE